MHTVEEHGISSGAGDGRQAWDGDNAPLADEEPQADPAGKTVDDGKGERLDLLG